ncbi:MAG TPA: EAL domain-containing protein [Sulfuriferula sp.]|nr:EAL domain-containing protein [Sulfuriferula sp.]
MLLKMPRGLSLRSKLVLLLLVVEVVMLTLLVVNSVRLSQESLFTQAQARYTELNTLFNAALAAPLAQRDYATLNEILAESAHMEGVIYAVLVDHSGHVVASAGWEKGQTLPVVTPPTKAADIRADRVDASTQIMLAGQQYGTLHYGVSTAFLTEARVHLVRQSILIAGVEILLSTLLLAGLGFWLTRHLATLTRASEAFAQGQLDIRLPVQSDDEVGSLTHAFNSMANAIAAQIGALKASTTQLHEEQARLVALLHAMKLGILFADTNNRIIYYNPALQHIWRLPTDLSLHGKFPAEAIMQTGCTLAEPDQLADLMTEPAGPYEERQATEIRLADGRLVTRLSHPVYDNANKFIGHLWMFEDITQEQQTAQQLIYLAERDSLTGLFNRHRLREELEKLLADAERSGSQGALLFFDLDEFKYINDTFGHHAGDATLIRIAAELSPLMRRNEVLARLGGDEFALLIPQISDLKEAEGLAERVVRGIARLPLIFDDQPLRVTVSLGIALYPQHGSTIEELIAHADTAMYQAKACGKNTWQVYRPDLDMGKEMVARLAWNDRLSHAFEKNLFRLHFQGVYHTADRRLSHLEALVRMIDEENPEQLVMPGLFITVAEKTGKILELDRWVISEAVTTLARHPKLRALAINLSGRSLADPLLPQYIQDTLARHAVTPSRLLIEITETSAIGDLHDAGRFIEALHLTGCATCLDDFGTGFSSFAYLKYLKVDTLKIDGLFIRDLPSDHDNQLFVKSIADVARGMGKITVAEFVEDAATLELLTQFGVDLVQGYFLDRPRPDHPALQG